MTLCLQTKPASSNGPDSLQGFEDALISRIALRGTRNVLREITEYQKKIDDLGIEPGQNVSHGIRAQSEFCCLMIGRHSAALRQLGAPEGSAQEAGHAAA